MSQEHILVIETGDGSRSLLNTALNESYHSTKGAMSESDYVFIQKGLKEAGKKEMKIAEFGFGTGLNSILTLMAGAEEEMKIEYVSIDNFPLNMISVRELGYEDILPAKYTASFYKIHEADWNKTVAITDNFRLHKILSDFESASPGTGFDLIYFDAFAPSKQPEAWSLRILEKCHEMLSEGGILVTYCAQGQFKRNLKSLGFTVEGLKGPPGKKEMTRAIKEGRG